MGLKVGNSVVFKKDDQYMALKNGYIVDKPYVIERISDAYDAIKITNENGESNWFMLNRFEKVTNKKRIKALEEKVSKQGEEISELKLIVEQLRKPSTVVEEVTAALSVEDTIEFEGKQYKKVEREAREGDVVVFTDAITSRYFIKKGEPYTVSRGIRFLDSDGCYMPIYANDSGQNRTLETVDVYELIPSFGTNIGQDLEVEYAEQVKQDVQHQTVPCAAVNKSNNQLRAEVIEKAKGFVEENSNKIHAGNNKRTTIRFVGEEITDILEFDINESERTVAALAKGKVTRKIYAHGIAKCNPSDVFNEHIGKAIALGRALGLDVSEFEQAVQPNEAVIGMKFIDRHGDTREIVGVGIYSRESMKSSIDSPNVQEYAITIINDSNAIYGEVE